jgi:glucose/arabinose dehydrogenase
VPWAARPGYEVEVFASGFQLPVDIAMVPDPGPHPGDPLLYVAELYGAVKVVTRDGTVRDYATGLLNFEPTGDFPGSGEQGLASLAIEPDSGDLLATLLYEDTASPALPKPHYPKLIRLHSDERGLTAEGETTVLDMSGEAQGASHQISNLTISPAGDLYVHNGDGGFPPIAQDLDSFRGKILRMTLDGQPSSGNPFYDDDDGITARDYVFSYGHRNPFGGAWRIADGSYYTVENGPIVDRLARVLAGENYRWPEDEALSHGASYNWIPAAAPVAIEFVEPGRFGGSGFPASSMGHAFVTESGSTYASGPQALGKRIVEFGLDSSGAVTSGPTELIRYTGVGKATAAGLAAGPDGLYFTDLYKDTGFASPIDRGANVLRISYCGEECPTEVENGPGEVRLEPESIDGLAPRVSRFRMSRAAFSVGDPAGAQAAAKSGTAFLYTLSERAAVRIRIKRLQRGRGPWGTLGGEGWPGNNRMRFEGRLRGRWLPAGRYVATIRARDPGGNLSKPRTTGFKVVRGR